MRGVRVWGYKAILPRSGKSSRPSIRPWFYPGDRSHQLPSLRFAILSLSHRHRPRYECVWPRILCERDPSAILLSSISASPSPSLIFSKEKSASLFPNGVPRILGGITRRSDNFSREKNPTETWRPRKKSSHAFSSTYFQPKDMPLRTFRDRGVRSLIVGNNTVPGN